MSNNQSFLNILSNFFSPPPSPTSILSPLPDDMTLNNVARTKALRRAQASEPMTASAATIQPMPYQNIIAAAAKANNLPPEFLAAALSRESGNFSDQYVKGYHTDGTGRGIAGIDKRWHPEVSDEQAFDPSYSINWMAKKLGDLNRQWGNTYDASRAYNGGNNFASQAPGYQGKTIDSLTRAHADAIKSLSEQYKKYFTR